MQAANEQDTNHTPSSLLRSRSFLIVSATLAIIFAAVARMYLSRYSMSAPMAACIYVAFTLLLILSLAPAFQRGPAAASAPPAYRVLPLVLVWCIPYLLY